MRGLTPRVPGLGWCGAVQGGVKIDLERGRAILSDVAVGEAAHCARTVLKWVKILEDVGGDGEVQNQVGTTGRFLRD